MKKFLFATLIALTGLAQQVFANDVVNNTNCDIRVTALVYSNSNTSTACSIVRTCMSVTVAAHSTATLPECIAVGTIDLLGFEVCWADVTCATVACVSIGNSSGPHPCPQFPLGPVFLTPCGSCAPVIAPVRVEWVYPTTGGANLIIG